MYTQRRRTQRPTEIHLAVPRMAASLAIKGVVLEGPADEPLKTFIVTTDEENIYINIA